MAARVAGLGGDADLDESARQRIEKVAHLLAADDIAGLLTSLVAVKVNLVEAHPSLARSIDDLAGQTDEVRARIRTRHLRDQRPGAPDIHVR